MGTKSTAVVTGASNGVGRACALAGCRMDTLQETVGPAGEHASHARPPVPKDVTSPAVVAVLFEAVHDEFGRLDVLFSSAGANVSSLSFEDVTPTFMAFGTQADQAEQVPDDYQRHLVNSLRGQFGLPGVPIRLQLRGTKNPYADG